MVNSGKRLLQLAADMWYLLDVEERNVSSFSAEFYFKQSIYFEAQCRILLYHCGAEVWHSLVFCSRAQLLCVL